MNDDGGVLGNLPHSRPGHRSEKRAGKRAQAAAPKPKPAAARRKPPPVPPRPAVEPAPSAAGSAIRTVTDLASGGARAATGVAREVLRRLPRP